jgi:glutathione peroxidase
MKLIALAAAALLLAAPAATAEDKPMTGPLNFKMKGIDGKDVDLAQYKGKVVLFVNVASACGYTPQYAGLQDLYQKYSKEGLVVIGVPSNDYGKQEPGSDADIQKFCSTNYKVTFPMLSKVAVKGKDKVPLYKYLTDKATNPASPGEVKWNFEKFLIGRDGKIAGRFLSAVEPTSEELTKAVQTELAKKP